MNWLIERFQNAPEHIAFNHEGEKFSYQDVVDLTAKFRSTIQAVGIGPTEIVVVLGDYSPDVFCMMLALALQNNIIIPLSNNSVIEQSEALKISGCDWRISFDADGHLANIERHGVQVSAPLLLDFQKRKIPGLILFSSGSTGNPKAILHDFSLVAEKFKKQRSPVIAIPFLMIDHFGGINTILAITSSLGTIVTISDRSVTSICHAIERYRVELLPATPSFLTLLMASGMYRQFDLSSLKRITYGTETMPQSTLDRVHEAFPSVLLQQTYGLSEVGVLSSKSREDGSLWLKVGGEGFKTKVVNNILWIKSDYAMIGYLNAPSEFDAEGWFNTQDQVEVDGEYFRILGRVTDLINVGGQKVYPAEVESVILSLENIQDVAVFGEKHPLLGQIVVAKIIVDQPESTESLKKRIRQACLAKLAPYKAPSKVIQADSALYSSRHKKIRHQI